jgi:hypothetical protein
VLLLHQGYVNSGRRSTTELSFACFQDLSGVGLEPTTVGLTLAAVLPLDDISDLSAYTASIQIIGDTGIRTQVYG